MVIAGLEAIGSQSIEQPIQEVAPSGALLQAGEYMGMPLIDPALTNENEGNNVTKTIGGKAVMRPSSLNVHCWYSYAQNAILGKKNKPGSASQLGTTYHYSMELGVKGFLATSNLPKTEDLVEIAVVNWATAVGKGDIEFQDTDDLPKMQKDLITGVRSYRLEDMRAAKAAEIRLNMPLPKASNVYAQLSGSVDRLDLVGNRVTIVDYKLTGKKVTANKYRMQAGLYGIMAQNDVDLKATLGIDHIESVEAMLHNAVRGRNLKTRGYVPTEQHKVLANFDQSTQNSIVSRVHEIIDKGELYHVITTELGLDPETAVKMVYPTTTPEVDYLCSDKWCGWYGICPMTNPEQLPQVDIVQAFKDLKEAVHYKTKEIV